MLTSLPEKYQKKIECVTESGCWLWTGTILPSGYGQARKMTHGVMQYARAHRSVYAHLRGPIPAGLTLDHLCRVKCCVNPDHLEPVTLKVNILRGTGPTALNAKKTHCLHGHALIAQNMSRHRTSRECAICQRAGQRRRRRASHPPGHA